MSAGVDSVLMPMLLALAAWSIRWGVLIAALAILFRVRPPSRASARHCLGTAVLVAGMALPLAPRWEARWVVARPSRVAPPATVEVVAPPSRIEAPPLPARPSAPRFVAIRPVRQADSRPAAAVPAGSTALVAPPASRRWSAGAWASVATGIIWVAGVAWMLARLVAGWVALGRLRRGATAPSEAAGRLLAECMREMGVRRRIALRTHPDVLSPVAMGGLEAMILVPEDWDDLPESARRACLAHELAHLARRDDLARMARELVRVPFFFHPMVAWLAARLDREAERICDEAAVASGADPRAYARLLLDFSRRGGRLRRRAAPGRRLALAFFDRGTVVDRIGHLLEDDMPRAISPLPTTRVVALCVAVAALALPIGALRVRAVQADEPPATTAATAKPEIKAERTAKGVVRDKDKRPIAGATVVVTTNGGSARQVVGETDHDGRFAIAVPDGMDYPLILVHKAGYAVSSRSASVDVHAKLGDVEFVLGPASPFVATLVDRDGKPVIGATVRVEAAAFLFENGASYAYYRPENVSGTPIGAQLAATTDDRGLFRLPSLAPGACPKLLVTAAGGGKMRIARKLPISVADHVSRFGAVRVKEGERPTIAVVPGGRVEGSLVTKLPKLGLAGRPVHLRSVRSSRGYDGANSGSTVTDAEGRFAFDGLFAGDVAVSLGDVPPDGAYTFRDAEASVEPGKTADVRLALVEGIVAEGTVVSSDGEPIPEVPVRVCDPKTGRCSRTVNTDGKGRYTLRAAPGEETFSIGGTVPGFSYGSGSSRTEIVPDGVTTFTVPPLTLEKSAPVTGRIVDAQGKPMAGAKVIGVCDALVCLPLQQPSSESDATGRFHLSDQNGGGFPVSRASSFQVRLASGKTFELKAVRDASGEVTLKVPALPDAKVKGPEKVAPDELAGVVVDGQGRPIAGAEIAVYHWMPDHRARTDARGRFKFEKFDPGNRVEVRVRKEGYETQFHLDKVVGEPGWVVVLGNSTYFEGRVLAPDGKPVPDALIRADSGPRRGKGVTLSECYTETTSGKDGRYRLYVEPGQYDISVRVPDLGVAGLAKQGISADQARSLDVALAPGVNFVARAVDSRTGKPVAGVALSHWQKPGIEGVSDADGLIQIKDVPPGTYPRFQVKADGYARFWSDACLSEWSRFRKEGFHGHGFQRNFDGLDFEIKPGMTAVTIALEKGVTVRGRVLDPDGKPVAGATVAPALTGSGNSLTGDTRFGTETGKDGAFTAHLPASGEAEYNLVAHDGKYQEWRTWANGVLPPMRTKPGEVIENVELRLSRPGTVSGRVVDARGKPVAGREVRAEPIAKDENRYYDPTAKTGPDGAFTLKFVRPGEHYIQVAPFWLLAEQAPEGSSRNVSVEAGKVASGIELTAQPER